MRQCYDKSDIFDLDGTLVQTERLKAISYARAAVELSHNRVAESEVIEAFKDFVGLSRQEVAQGLVDRFGLKAAAAARMPEFGVDMPWQAFVQIRLAIYEQMLADPEVLLNNRWPHNLALVEKARQGGCKLGLATMSYCPQVRRVLRILDLDNTFDFVASRDDVEHGKPDPEIYLTVANQLEVQPNECLVIEDSPTGVKAALNAKMWCIAVTTPFTRQAIRAQQLLPAKHIVDEPEQLPDAVTHLLEDPAGNGH